ncbi:MAG: hypothetical protein GXX85_09270 [Ignavibacteria bacterium]|nr:hypothetical protein [Ignavibacteria bacterium]
MAGNQTILVLGGIILFSYLILNFNNASITQLNLSLENEAIITATAVGQSIIDEAQSRAFDENTVSNFVDKVADLSLSLKSDNEVNSTDYDDVDDYNGMKRTETLGRLGNFDLEVEVYYVNKSTLAKSFAPTFSKRIDVKIKNNYLPNEIKLSHVVSY